MERDIGAWKQGNKSVLRIMSRRKYKLWLLAPGTDWRQVNQNGTVFERLVFPKKCQPGPKKSLTIQTL